jgi:hypothetical protein
MSVQSTTLASREQSLTPNPIDPASASGMCI